VSFKTHYGGCFNHILLRINTNKYEYLYQITYNKKPPPRELGRGTNYEKLQT